MLTGTSLFISTCEFQVEGHNWYNTSTMCTGLICFIIYATLPLLQDIISTTYDLLFIKMLEMFQLLFIANLSLIKSKVTVPYCTSKISTKFKYLLIPSLSPHPFSLTPSIHIPTPNRKHGLWIFIKILEYYWILQPVYTVQ